MYVYIVDNKVRELIPDIDPIFPNVDISERYSSDILSNCIHVEDDADVKRGMIYNREEDQFTEPSPSPTPTVTPDVDSLKLSKIEESKIKLAEWLSENPMVYTDGKKYTVTAEKQALLNSNLASYERSQKAGIPYPLKWNASGEECVDWDYDSLVVLSIAIAAYVAPKVSEQQILEISINTCKTIEELEKVTIDYE